MDNTTRSMILEVVEDALQEINELELGMMETLREGEDPEEAKQALRRMIIERLQQNSEKPHAK